METMVYEVASEDVRVDFFGREGRGGGAGHPNRRVLWNPVSFPLLYRVWSGLDCIEIL